MSKLWLVCRYEFRLNVFKKSFLLVLLSIPLYLALLIVMGIVMEASQKDDAPVGYIDQSGLLSNPVSVPGNNPDEALTIIAFENRVQAVAALDAQEVQAVFILAPNYLQSGDIELLFFKQPRDNAYRQFYDFLQANLLSEQPPQVAQHLVEGSTVIVRSLQDGREFTSDAPLFEQVLTLVVALAFIGMIAISAGYLMDTVFKEKENRTIEVVSTSISPTEMIWGKVLSVVGISLTLLLAWTAIIILAVYLGGSIFNIEWLQNPDIDWAGLLNVVVIAIPTFIATYAFMFASGVFIASRQESEQIGPLYFFIYFIPLYFIALIVEHPNGLVSVLLSMLPVTSLLTVGLRSAFTAIPTWQIALSFAIQTLAALAALWLAAKAYRLGMLRYGQHVRLAELWGSQSRRDLNTRGSHAKTI